MYNICLSSSESSVYSTEEEMLTKFANDLFRNVQNTFGFLKCCCNRMVSKLNKTTKCLTHSKNTKQEKNTVTDEKVDGDLNRNVNYEINCLYSATEFSNYSSSVCLSTERYKENMIFMNKQYLSSSSLFHASSFGFSDDAVRCSETVSHTPLIRYMESNKGFQYRNIKNRITRKIHSEEVNKKHIKRKCKRSYSHGMLTETINSAIELHVFLTDFENMMNSSKFLPRKLSKAVNFKESSGDKKKDVFRVDQSRSKMSESHYCITRCDANVISSSSYQSSNYEPTLYYLSTRRKRIRKSVKSFLSYATIRKWRHAYRQNARNILSKAFSQINFSRTSLILESRHFQRSLSLSLINKLLLKGKSIELDDGKLLELKVQTEFERATESYSTICDSRSSIFDKSSLFSSDRFLSETCSKSAESITFYIDCENTYNKSEEILIAERTLSNIFDMTLKILKTKKQGSTLLITKSSYTDALSTLSADTSYTGYETLMIHIEDEEEHNSNDFEVQQLTGQNEFLKKSLPKLPIYESIVNKPKRRRSRSFYSDNNGSKHCVICGRYETKNRRYALPTCIVKGATLLPKPNNNPWTRVVEKVNCSSCQSKLSKVLPVPHAGKSGFPETLKTPERSVRRKREMLSDGGNLNKPCSLDKTLRRFYTSNVEINVINNNDTMNVTIIELSCAEYLNYMNCIGVEK